MPMLEDYMNGMGFSEIGKKYGFNTEPTRWFLQEHIKALRNIHETRLLIEDQKADDNCTTALTKKGTLSKTLSFKGVKDIDQKINECFLNKLSDPLDHILTEDEINYCYLIVHENNWQNAMEDSGLNEGLLRSNDGYKRALRLRHLYLKKKPNIAKYINELQLKNLKEAKLDKQHVQSKLIQRIEILENQNDPKHETTLAKYYHMLGQSVGAFTEKIEIQEVSLDDVVKQMKEIRMRRAEETSTEREKYIEPQTWVYDENNED